MQTPYYFYYSYIFHMNKILRGCYGKGEWMKVKNNRQWTVSVFVFEN